MKICNKTFNNEISDELINKREKQWGKKIPQCFVDFLRENNGGIPSKRIHLDEKIFIERFFAMLSDLKGSENAIYDISCVATKYDSFLVFDEDAKGYDLIPFAQLNHDRLLCLCYKSNKPYVGILRLDSSKDFCPDVKKIYDSFDDFLAFLKS